MKTFMIRSFIGIFFGAFIAVLITILFVYFGESETIDANLFVKNSIGSMICGWFFTVSPLYFEIRKLKLYQQTILHFATVMILYLILAISIGWVPFNTVTILLTVVIAIVVYSIMWSLFYLYFKNQAQKLNDAIKMHFIIPIKKNFLASH